MLVVFLVLGRVLGDLEWRGTLRPSEMLSGESFQEHVAAGFVWSPPCFDVVFSVHPGFRCAGYGEYYVADICRGTEYRIHELIIISRILVVVVVVIAWSGKNGDVTTWVVVEEQYVDNDEPRDQ